MAVTATFLKRPRSLKRPRVFHKGEPTLVVCQSDCSLLSKLAKHSDWDSSRNGLRTLLQAKLGAKIGAMQSQILGRFSAQPKVYHLANQELTVSHTFIQRLITFIDSTYNNLCHVSHFQENQAWALTMTLVDRILANLFAPQSGVYCILKVQEREDACSQLL